MEDKLDCLMGGTLQTHVEANEDGLPYTVVTYRVGRQINWIKLDDRQIETFIAHLNKASIKMQRIQDGNRNKG